MNTSPKVYKPVTIKRIKEIPKYKSLSDEEAQNVIDTLKALVHICLKIVNDNHTDEQETIH